MAAHSLDNLLRLWGLDQITTEQTIGQILQILRDLEARVIHVEQSAAASTRANIPPPAPPIPPTARERTVAPTVSNPRRSKPKIRNHRQTKE